VRTDDADWNSIQVSGDPRAENGNDRMPEGGRYSTCIMVVVVSRIGTCLSLSIPAPRLGAALAPSCRNAKFWQKPLRQDYVGGNERQPPNPVRHVHFSYLPTPSLRRIVIMGHQFDSPD
jgi:hypothetical protein